MIGRPQDARRQKRDAEQLFDRRLRQRGLAIPDFQGTATDFDEINRRVLLDDGAGQRIWFRYDTDKPVLGTIVTGETVPLTFERVVRGAHTGPTTVEQAGALISEEYEDFHTLGVPDGAFAQQGAGRRRWTIEAGTLPFALGRNDAATGGYELVYDVAGDEIPDTGVETIGRATSEIFPVTNAIAYLFGIVYEAEGWPTYEDDVGPMAVQVDALVEWYDREINLLDTVLVGRYEVTGDTSAPVLVQFGPFTDPNDYAARYARVVVEEQFIRSSMNPWSLARLHTSVVSMLRHGESVVLGDYAILRWRDVRFERVDRKTLVLRGLGDDAADSGAAPAFPVGLGALAEEPAFFGIGGAPENPGEALHVYGTAHVTGNLVVDGDVAAVDDHTGDTSGAHAASAIGFTPAGSIAATNVQAAIEEVSAEAGGAPDAADVVFAPTGDILATDVQAAIEEVRDDAFGVIGAVGALDFLVGTASGVTPNEIVAGTTPQGELGGTWGSPTVDASHSGSTHAATQAAAEATAATALSGHAAAGDPHAGYRLESADHSHASTGLQGGTVAHSSLTSVSANQHHNEDHASRHQSAGADAIKLDDLAAPDDNTDLDASTSKHGLLKKLPGGTTDYLRADGTFATPPGTGGVSFATPGIALGSAAAAGSAGTAIRSDSTIAAFDATSPTTQAMGDSAVVGTAAFAARRDHKHAMPALGTTAAAIGTSSGGSATTPSKSDHVHATGAGTPSTQAFGDAAATGSGPAAAMTDHKHAMPAAVEAVTALSYGSPWADQGAPWQGGRYWKDRDGVVHVEGLVKRTTTNNTTIATLPLGYRPAADHRYILWGYDAVTIQMATVDVIAATGIILLSALGAASASLIVSLDGIQFRV